MAWKGKTIQMASFVKASIFRLLIITMLIAAEYESTPAVTEVPPNNRPTGQVLHQLHNVTSSKSVEVNAKTTLSCFTHPVKDLVMIRWQIFLRDRTPCIIAYREDKKETMETNCSGEGVTWESKPEWNHTLHIHPVTTANDGYYKCVFVTPAGNFQTAYHLSVLVPPVVTLSEEGNGTIACKAAAGKPAAQISWAPKGDCFTVNETHDDRTVTVKSTCTWDDSSESTVTCFISHLTGNKSLFTEHQSHRTREPPILLCLGIVEFFILGGILSIGECLLFRKRNGGRCSKPTDI
ncbi:cell surface glycoprotein CD200 receptor 2-like [Petaurus breviceps papuanus]|uniref:cell surface glycoprotein CD200 receptor 2-like n=1 Tax=Petaurus breviceps papuanus TaxID=3040969 RepID=UPI0036DC030A